MGKKTTYVLSLEQSTRKYLLVGMDRHLTKRVQRDKNCGQRKKQFPRFSVPFDVHTGTRNCQLLGVLLQEKKTVDLFPIKLMDTQKRYRNNDTELISIVENLKQFCKILLDESITVYTDQNNIIHKPMGHDCNNALRQKIQYIQGENEDTDKNK